MKNVGFAMRTIGTAGLLLAIAALAAPALAQAPSPAVQAEKRLADLLQPAGTAPSAPGSRPMAWPGPKTIERPRLAPAIYRGLPPPPPVASFGKNVPRAVAESAPPVVLGARPKRRPLPTEALVQLSIVDVDAPLPLPILARPKQDRASLDDATLEASQAAALGRVTPRRRQPVPFAPINLPDPFENARVGGLRSPPDESDQPPAIPIRTPNR